MTTSAPKCLECIHYLIGRNCDAFPDPLVIPDDIWTGDNDHSGPVQGDGGLTFKKFEDEDES